jgi:hypothetical protein
VNQNTGHLIRANASADTTVVGTGFNGFLMDFEFGPDGALYISDLGLGTIWRISRDQTSGVDEAGGPASAAAMRIVHPNPFTPPAGLSFEIPASGHAARRVFDIQGRLVRTLVDGTSIMGVHATEWDGRDAAGLPVPAGIYFYRLESGMATRTSKVVLIP